MKSRPLVASVLIVAATVPIIAELAGFGLFLKGSSSPDDVTAGRMGRLCADCILYKQRVKSWPTNPAALKAIPGFTTNVLVDAWGRPFIWIPPTNSSGPL